MRNRHPIVVTVSWIALGVGSALIYSGWQAAPGREELLALGLTMVLIALILLGSTLSVLVALTVPRHDGQLFGSTVKQTH